jgi:hypothetical protein
LADAIFVDVSLRSIHMQNNKQDNKKGSQMQDDKQTLEQLNIRIGAEESKGDDESRRWFEGVIAPKLAFRRADGVTIDNRDEFLQKVKPSDRRETEVESIIAGTTVVGFPKALAKRRTLRAAWVSPDRGIRPS